MKTTFEPKECMRPNNTDFRVLLLDIMLYGCLTHVSMNKDASIERTTITVFAVKSSFTFRSQPRFEKMSLNTPIFFFTALCKNSCCIVSQSYIPFICLKLSLPCSNKHCSLGYITFASNTWSSVLQNTCKRFKTQRTHGERVVGACMSHWLCSKIDINQKRRRRHDRLCRVSSTPGSLYEHFIIGEVRK